MEKSSQEAIFINKNTWKTAAAGAASGIINGLFGAGGGMILIPLLTKLTDLEDSDIFPASISIILPMCIVTLGMALWSASLPFEDAIGYLLGSCVGGFLAGKLVAKIPTLWLHRILGILILWGGYRYLC